MKIPVNWLKDYVNVKLSAEEIADKLTMAGLEVENIEKLGQDTVLEAEVTSNRPDWLSIIGVAREVSALTGKKLQLPKNKEKVAASKGHKTDKIEISIEDKQGCKRYIGWVIDGVRVGPSPNWLVEKLESVGLRSINNIVDITNFVLFEYGQPMHAFDYDKLQGKKIIVRKAKNNEEIITLDGIKRKLDKNKLVIADEKGPVALAGVMGGLEAEVSPSTKTILLESAYFDPPTIRRASRALAISTDSSYRFERNVDYEMVYEAALRAAYLFEELAGAKIAEKPVDIDLKKSTSKKILLSTEEVDKILGTHVPDSSIKKILSMLGFGIKQKKGAFEVVPPSFRNDVNIPEDLVEEIARIWQYDKIPVAVPKSPLEIHKPKQKLRIAEDTTRDILVGLGLDEIISYSLTSKELLGACSLLDENVIELANPLSSEQAIMRSSLVPGMLNMISWNLNRKNLDLKSFELSKIYTNDHGKTHEEINLCIAITGNRFDDWQNKQKPVEFYDLKGLIEVLFVKLGIQDCRFIPDKKLVFSKGACACVEIEKKTIGFIGKIDIAIQKKLDIQQEVFMCELNFEKIFPHISLERKYRQIPKIHSVTRDISIVVPEGISAQEIISAVKRVGKDLVKDVKIFDEYHGEKIPQGQRSIAFSIEYLDESKPLTEIVINEIHLNTCNELRNALHAQIR